MKLILKILIGLVVVVVVLAAAGVGYLTLAFPKKRPVSDLVIEPTPERLARGRYLVHHVTDCLGCHSDHLVDRWALPIRPGSVGQGGFIFDENLGVPGVVTAQNITQDSETGLGAWTDDEILRAFREGVSRDGRPLFPMMPYEGFRHLSDEDAYAIVTYLRTLQPIRHQVPQTRIRFPVNLIIRTLPQPLDGRVTAPGREQDPLAYGQYLATVSGCAECHTPRDQKNQPLMDQAFSGGWEMVGPWGRVVTSNLTPHPDTYVGQATKEDFIGRFKTYESMNATNAPPAMPGMNTIMPWLAYSGMTEEDLGAIYDYLKTLAPVERRVVKFPAAQRATRR
ncbi:MAG TPA: c-type cytochrome [Thermoanaerobaculia bacterium]|nr:c-type cytochrome [Thermoanaerobaculia bacterium]